MAAVELKEFEKGSNILEHIQLFLYGSGQFILKAVCLITKIEAVERGMPSRCLDSRARHSRYWGLRCRRVGERSAQADFVWRWQTSIQLWSSVNDSKVFKRDNQTRNSSRKDEQQFMFSVRADIHHCKHIFQLEVGFKASEFKDRAAPIQSLAQRKTTSPCTAWFFIQRDSQTPFSGSRNVYHQECSRQLQG